MAIQKEDLDRFQQALIEEKKRLEENIEALKNMDFGSAPGEDNEEADESEEASNSLATIQTLGDRVVNIDDALSRIDNNAYGVCKNCGGEIDLELLEINPESATCRDCKD